MLWVTLLWLWAAASHADPYIPKPQRDLTGNLLQHGSFDEPVKGRGGGHADGFRPGTTEVTGWKVSGGTISVFNLGDMPYARCVVLGTNAMVSQAIDLPAGRNYQVSFLLTCAPAGPPLRTGVVRIAGKQVPFTRKALMMNETNDSNYWDLVSFEVAGTGRTVLEIQSTTVDSGQHGPTIADVAIQVKGFTQSGPPPETQATGTIVSVAGDVLTIDQQVSVGGRMMPIRLRYFLQKSSKLLTAPTAGSRVHIKFQLAPDGRRLINELAP